MQDALASKPEDEKLQEKLNMLQTRLYKVGSTTRNMLASKIVKEDNLLMKMELTQQAID